MPEDIQHNITRKTTPETTSAALHTCACGEQHEEIPGPVSHRDTCTSPRKFGDSCCCAAGETGRIARSRCSHGPRCH